MVLIMKNGTPSVILILRTHTQPPTSGVKRSTRKDCKRNLDYQWRPLCRSSGALVGSSNKKAWILCLELCARSSPPPGSSSFCSGPELPCLNKPSRLSDASFHPRSPCELDLMSLY